MKNPKNAKLITWKLRSLFSADEERINQMFSNGDIDRIDDNFIKDVSDRHRSLNSKNIQFSILSFLLLIACGTTIGNSITQIGVFGFSVNQIPYSRELLTVCAFTLNVYATCLSAQSRSMKHTIECVLKNMHLNETMSDLLKLRYLDKPLIFSSKSIENIETNFVTSSIIISLLISVVGFSFIIMASNIILQISSINELTSSTSEQYIKYILISYCVFCFVIWAALESLMLPLPARDYSGLKNMMRLKDENPEEYAVTLGHYAQNRRKFINVWIEIVAFFSYIATTLFLGFKNDDLSEITSQEIIPYFIAFMFINQISSPALSRIIKIISDKILLATPNKYTVACNLLMSVWWIYPLILSLIFGVRGHMALGNIHSSL